MRPFRLIPGGTGFCAEVSSNHHCDLDRALAFVDCAARMGTAAVKFQQFKIRELFAPEALRHDPELLKREAWELPLHFNQELARRARERGIAFSSTPFSLGAIAEIEPHVDFIKLASYQLPWTEVLREVARTAKPVVLSTGMAEMDEVRCAVDVLGSNGCESLALLHCVSLYPMPPAAANLSAMQSLRSAFGVAVGWSDHSRDERVVRRAIAAHKAEWVEFHLDLDGKGAEYPSGHCWLPGEIEPLIREFSQVAPEAEHSVSAFGQGVGGERAGALETQSQSSDPLDGNGRVAPHPDESHEREWRSDPHDGLRPFRRVRAGLSEYQP